jgi:hypothetical protein
VLNAGGLNQRGGMMVTVARSQCARPVIIKIDAQTALMVSIVCTSFPVLEGKDMLFFKKNSRWVHGERCTNANYVSKSTSKRRDSFRSRILT